MGAKPRTVDQISGQIAASQHGVVTRRELLAAGVGRRAIAQRLARGALLPTYRGVYRVGHRAPSAEAAYLAAVKACGRDAVLSGRAAAWLWRLLKGPAPRPEVTNPKQRHVPGLLTRCCRSLSDHERTSRHGIPVTSVPRTLVDLAGVLTEDELARACHEAAVLHRTTPAQVDVVLRSNAPGAAKLRRVLHGDAPVTLSKLESRFLQLLREEGLALPQTNKPAGGRYVDCRWPEHKLTVELDSYRFHSSRFSWEQDRRREREAYARGDDLRRYVWTDVFEDRTLMLAELRELTTARPRAQPAGDPASREIGG